MSIFKVKTEEGKIVVEATLVPYDPKRNPRQKVGTHLVEAYLKENGIKHGKCIKSVNLCNSTMDALTGAWIFESFEKKIEKTLDKPAEKVILTKEEKSAPKLRKNKAKKKTNK
tara:strand:+ start:167 stop:505 length:339 start_codon:yes stop_codon:yes gene_type:complete